MSLNFDFFIFFLQKYIFLPAITAFCTGAYGRERDPPAAGGLLFAEPRRDLLLRHPGRIGGS